MTNGPTIMGYNVSVYSFYGARIPESNLVKYFSNLYEKDIIKDGYVGKEKEYVTEFLGMDWIFQKEFGYRLVFFSKNGSDYKYYLVVDKPMLIYRYDTDSEEYDRLPYECDMASLKSPGSVDTAKIDEIMKKLKVNNYNVRARVICDESF
jgi:hypothetical protein